MAKVKEARTLTTGLRLVTKLEDTVPPTVNDDASDDVGAGTTWTQVDANGLPIASFVCTDPTNGAAVWLGLSEKDQGVRIGYIDEIVTLNGSSANALVNQLPAGAIPLFAALNNETALVLATAVKVGLGTSGSIVGIGLTGTGVTKNTKNALNGGALCGVPVAAATTLQLKACATDGTAAGTMTSGKVRCRVFYQIYDVLPDAA